MSKVRVYELAKELLESRARSLSPSSTNSVSSSSPPRPASSPRWPKRLRGHFPKPAAEPAATPGCAQARSRDRHPDPPPSPTSLAPDAAAPAPLTGSTHGVRPGRAQAATGQSSRRQAPGGHPTPSAQKLRPLRVRVPGGQGSNPAAADEAAPAPGAPRGPRKPSGPRPGNNPFSGSQGCARQARVRAITRSGAARGCVPRRST